MIMKYYYKNYYCYDFIIKKYQEIQIFNQLLFNIIPVVDSKFVNQTKWLPPITGWLKKN